METSTALCFPLRTQRIILSLIILLFFSYNSKAQTFSCSDVQIYKIGLNGKKIQEVKSKLLGSKCDLTFYDRSVRLSVSDDGKIRSIILNKVTETEYSFTCKNGNKTERAKMVINKTMGMISTFTLSHYINNSLEIVITYKRKVL